MSSTAFLADDFQIVNSYVSIKWRFQKNNDNGQIVSFAKSDIDNRCPVAAASRILCRARRLSIASATPLACFLKHHANRPSYITDEHISAVLRGSAGHVYHLSSKEDLSKWTPHSLRIGACVALHAAGADPTTIKHRLRWRSDTFL